ncbi:hypothetical protein [Nocardioides sambongensis]|uniref:hypothetical protein n=1 Tax=Nocardioides sambongensis TaxID=2589074 RepID=UPI0015E82BEC|nr:hypothetical protein [Nocardioides sambongensis]
MTPRARGVDGPTGAFLAYLTILAVVLVAFGARLSDAREPGTTTAADVVPQVAVSVVPSVVGAVATDPAETTGAQRERTEGRRAEQAERAPRWQREPVFTPRRMLVAYYGTAGSGALGVLGEGTPERAHRRLARAAAAFERGGQEVQPVYELIVTVADAHPGRDGDYNHDIARADVARYLAAARRQGARVVLDLQTGRADFGDVARRWEWALRRPHVDLALDPEWRMGPREVPGQVVGAVRAAEVNRVSDWLSALVVRHDLPEKLLVVHQFRTTMLPDIEKIRDRDGLALVQHVDGFGTPGQKRATFDAVAHPRTFRMGFKLFYDEDVRLMGPRAVHAIDPRVRFVSYQ